MLAEVTLRTPWVCIFCAIFSLCLFIIIPIFCGIFICKEKIRSTIAHLFERKKANPHEGKECQGKDGTSQNYQIITTREEIRLNEDVKEVKTSGCQLRRCRSPRRRHRHRRDVGIQKKVLTSTPKPVACTPSRKKLAKKKFRKKPAKTGTSSERPLQQKASPNLTKRKEQSNQCGSPVRKSNQLQCINQRRPTLGDEEECIHETFIEVVCELQVKTRRHAVGIPEESEDDPIIINGINNRRGAFHRDLVKVKVFGKNNKEQRFGRVIEIKEARHPTIYVCTADQVSANTFYPIDRLAPAIRNRGRSYNKIVCYSQKRFNESYKDKIAVFEDSNDSSSDNTQLKIKESIPLEKASSLLFIMKVLRWSTEYSKPLGTIIEALPRTTSISNMEKLLKVVHNISHDHEGVPESDNTSTVIHATTEISEHEIKYHNAITIDPADAKGLDDAFSIIPIDEEDTYELAVLITDVAKYIEKDSKLDITAKNNATTVNAGQLNHQIPCSTLNMLPHKHIRKLSLRSGKIRDVIVVSAKVKIQHEKVTIINLQNPETALIKPAINLQYKESQFIMDGQTLKRDLQNKVEQFESCSDLTLKKTLYLLFCVAMNFRCSRLYEAANSYLVSKDAEDENDWKSHLLVEELMIWANKYVAEYMLQECPDVAILYFQRLPSQEDLSEVCKAHENELCLSRYFRSLRDDESSPNMCKGNLEMTFEMIKTLKLAYSHNKISKAIKILSQEMNFPQLAVIETKIDSISKSSEYICTGGNFSSIKGSNPYFNCTMKCYYTRFSSPIRRYFDIVVQRILRALINHDDIPYDGKELISLCKLLNLKTKMAVNYSKDIDRIQIASLLDNEGMKKMQAYITCLMDKRQKFHLCFPIGMYDLFMPRQYTEFDLSEMSYSMKDDDALKWQVILVLFNGPDYYLKCPKLDISHTKEGNALFNVYPFENYRSNKRIQKTFMATVRSDVCHVKLETWENAQRFIQDPSRENLRQFVDELPIEPNWSPPPEDIASDFHNSPLIQFFIRKKFCVGSVVDAWIGKSINNPIPSPALHMIEVAPSVRICLQHTQNPVMCFSSTRLQVTSKESYRSKEEYVDLWSKALFTEATYDSVRMKKIIILKDVLLSWPMFVKVDACLKPEEHVIFEIPKGKNDIMDFINIKPDDLVCARYEVPYKGKVYNAVYHFVIDKLVDGEDITNTKVFMLASGEDGYRVSEKMRQVLESRPKCEMQIIKLSVSFR